MVMRDLAHDGQAQAAAGDLVVGAVIAVEDELAMLGGNAGTESSTDSTVAPSSSGSAPSPSVLRRIAHPHCR
jgi:hypothetical protein